MPRQARALVVIPTYDEAENVEVIVSGIRLTGLALDLLFVDDNSPDGTGTILDRMAAEYPRMHVLHRTGKQGIGSAHKAGINWAYEHGYTRLVTMDSDLSHAPHDIGRLLKAGEDADVIVGSRFRDAGSLKGWAWNRKLMTHLGHLLTSVFLGLPQDCTNAFRFYRLDRIPAGIFAMVESDGYSFFYESLHRLHVNGSKIAEISIDLPARTYGHSKMRLRDVLHSVKFLWRLGWRTRLNRAALIHVASFEGVDTGDQAQAAWQAYWSGTGHEGKWLYDLVAAAYRRVIIRPAVTHFLSGTFARNSELLHAGCGSGMVDIGIADRFEITALDIAPLALTEYARQHGRRARLLQGSIFAIPSEAGRFDGVFNLGVMEHFTEAEIALILGEFHRVLKPGGRIVLFWPPAYGLATQALKLIHLVLKSTLRKNIVLHPPELTHVVSRRQVHGFLVSAGFALEVFYFGPRDMFTHRIVVARRSNGANAMVAPSVNDGASPGPSRSQSTPLATTPGLQRIR